jgi:chemotaxis protein MotB
MKPNYLLAESAGQRDRWTVSYLDVLTILLIFFVAAAAKTLPTTSAPDTTPKLPQPPPIQWPAPVSIPPEPKQSSVLETAQQMLENSGLEARLEQRGLVISISQAVLFASGEDRVSVSALPTVKQIADVLRTLPNRVILIGHADSIPIHNHRFKNNWELSAARGLRLLETLTDRYGLDEARLSVSSDGAYRPASSNDTPTGRASNRRVEILVVDESVAQN